MPISKDDPRLERCGFAKLQGDAGDDFVYFIRKYEVVLGRRSKSAILDVPLGDSMNISRHHAAIKWNFAAQRWEIEVRGKNGVHVNDVLVTPAAEGEPPRSPTPLQSQDKLVIGDRTLWFLLPKRGPAPHQATRFPPAAKPQQHMMMMQQQAMAAAQRLGRPSGMGAPPYGWQGPRPPAEAAAAAAAAAAAHLRGPLGPPGQTSRPMFPGGATSRAGQQPRPPGPGPRPHMPGGMHPMLGAYMAAAMAAGGGSDAAAAEGSEGDDAAPNGAEGAAQAAALMAARQAGGSFPPAALMAAAQAGDPQAMAQVHMLMQMAAQMQQQQMQQGATRPAGGQRGGGRR